MMHFCPHIDDLFFSVHVSKFPKTPKYVAHQSRNCLINFRRTNGVNGQSVLAFGPFRAREL